MLLFCSDVLDVIEDVRWLGVAPIDTHIEHGLRLLDKSDLLNDPGQYKRLVVRLIYLTISRQDIMFDAHILG